MATTAKRCSKKSKVTRTASRVESVSQLKKTIASQKKTIATQARELRQALVQQAATGEVLRIIASSPTELQPVLDNLLANAVELSGATKGYIRQYDGEFLRYVPHYNESPQVADALNQRHLRPLADSMSARALLEKNPVHVLDAQAEPNFRVPAVHARHEQCYLCRFCVKAPASERSPSGATLSKRLRNGRSNLLKPSLTRR